MLLQYPILHAPPSDPARADDANAANFSGKRDDADHSFKALRSSSRGSRPRRCPHAPPEVPQPPHEQRVAGADELQASIERTHPSSHAPDGWSDIEGAGAVDQLALAHADQLCRASGARCLISRADNLSQNGQTRNGDSHSRQARRRHSGPSHGYAHPGLVLHQ